MQKEVIFIASFSYVVYLLAFQLLHISIPLYSSGFLMKRFSEGSNYKLKITVFGKKH